MGTTLFRGGRVIDGTGDPGFDGHVLVEGDRIRAVFREGEELPAADSVIAATDCFVSPGFIDMHSHADWLLPVDEHPGVIKCLVEQGVTTLVTGNCGFSPAPFSGGARKIMRALPAILIDKPFDFTWKSMAEFLDHLEEVGPALNTAQLVGHATLRYAAADTLRGALRPDELKRCLDQVRRALAEGACGLSFGLGYDPGMYSPLAELSAFCSAAAEAGKPVTVHLKAFSVISPCYPFTSLRPHNVRALEEMLTIAQATGTRLQLSHFIFVGRRSWRTAETCIRMVEEARRRGVDVMVDAFPYTCGNTTINVSLPYWFLARLPRGYKSRRARMRLRAELELGYRLVGFHYRDFQVMNAGVTGWEELNGLTLPELARRWQTSPFNAMLRLSEASRGGALMLYHTYSGEPGNEVPIESVLSHDLCLFETDAVLRSTGYSNPAATGAFPKILGDYVRERKLFSIENAVKRMTSASADRFGLKGRGVLAPGRDADIVVFDPETIADTPPVGSQPAGKPRGIRHVFINGKQVVKDGSYLEGVRPGRVLRV